MRQDVGQLHFCSTPPARRPRHAFLPRWHFDMLGDTQRNAAYQTAIENAVRFSTVSTSLVCLPRWHFDMPVGQCRMSDPPLSAVRRLCF